MNRYQLIVTTYIIIENFIITYFNYEYYNTQTVMTHTCMLLPLNMAIHFALPQADTNYSKAFIFACIAPYINIFINTVGTVFAFFSGLVVALSIICIVRIYYKF